MKHKLAQVMLERNASKRLKGNVQMDDAYIGEPGPAAAGAAQQARRHSSLRSRQRTMASQIKSSFQQLCDPQARKHRAQPRHQYRLRRSGMLRRCHPSRMPAHFNQDRERQASGPHPCFQMGQYRVRQYQSRPRGDLPSRARKTRSSISRGDRISIQSPIRSQNHDPPPRIRCAEDRPDALPLAKTG